MTPLDRMIMASVKCLTCGAGYGKCDCARKRRETEIEAEFQRLMKLNDDELIAVCKARGVEIKPQEKK